MRIGLALAALVLAGCAGTPKKYSHYDRGMQLRGDGKTDEAILEFQQSLQAEPQDPTVQNALGDAYYAKGFKEQALAAWEKALESGSTDPSFYQKGGVIRSAEWIDDGIKSFTAARDNAVRAWMDLAASHVEKGNWADAIALWEKVVRHQKDQLDAWRGLGKGYKKLKDMQKAYPAWKAAVELAPKEPDLQKEFGYAAFATGALNEAESAFRKWVALDPSNPLAYNNLGAVLAKMERYGESYAAYDKALEKHPDMIAALNGKGTTYYYQKKYDEARALWAKVLELAPDDPTAKENIRTLVKMGY